MDCSVGEMTAEASAEQRLSWMQASELHCWEKTAEANAAERFCWMEAGELHCCDCEQRACITYMP